MTQILKKNAYKCVRLQLDEQGQRFVSKAYSNQGAAQDVANTRYIDQALTFFYENFSPYVRVPRPLATSLYDCEISMEYLPDLPQARHIRLSEVPRARAFFEACYRQRDDAGFLRYIDSSVIMNPVLEKLLKTDFPLALGLKGDLSENLVVGNDRLILADIDSICLEPLGLSELILYAERLGSSTLHPFLQSLITPPPLPVAFEHLNEAQCFQLVDAAVSVLDQRMKRINPPLRTLKHHMADSALKRLIRRRG